MSSHFVPIILLSGYAGSGKDTVGSYIEKVHGGVCVAQADPMKRFVREVFGFSEEQLWGPSEMRNAVDQSTVENRGAIADRFYDKLSRNEILGSVIEWTKDRADLLADWFVGVHAQLLTGTSISPRKVLQTLGTECGRRMSKEMWSLYSIETAKKLLGGGHRYTKIGGLAQDPAASGVNFVQITDGRFRNEPLNVRVGGGIALLVKRAAAAGGAAAMAAGVQGHSSEKELNEIPRHFFNDVIDNNGTIVELANKVDGALRYFYGV